MATADYEDTLDSDELLSRMRSLNKKFKNACNQVILLNNQIEYLQVRYDGAVKANKRSYRYFLRLRLATLEGIRNMFYEYACRRADELDEMQDQLVQDGVIDSDYDMDEDSDSNVERNQVHMPVTAMDDNSCDSAQNVQLLHTPQPENIFVQEQSAAQYNHTISQEETIENSGEATFISGSDVTSNDFCVTTSNQREIKGQVESINHTELSHLKSTTTVGATSLIPRHSSLSQSPLNTATTSHNTRTANECIQLQPLTPGPNCFTNGTTNAPVHTQRKHDTVKTDSRNTLVENSRNTNHHNNTIEVDEQGSSSSQRHNNDTSQPKHKLARLERTTKN